MKRKIMVGFEFHDGGSVNTHLLCKNVYADNSNANYNTNGTQTTTNTTTVINSTTQTTPSAIQPQYEEH